MLWFMGFRSLVTKRHYYKSYIKEVLHSPGAPGGSVALKPLITRTSADSKLEYGRPLNHSAMFFFLLHTLAVAFYLMVCVWLQHKSVYDKCRLKCEIGNQNAQQVGTWILSVCAVSGHFPSCDCTQIKVHHPPPPSSLLHLHVFLQHCLLSTSQKHSSPSISVIQVLSTCSGTVFYKQHYSGDLIITNVVWMVRIWWCIVIWLGNLHSIGHCEL